MEDDYADDCLEAMRDDCYRYCEDCRVLTEALRDMEQQCREVEDAGVRSVTFSSASDLAATLMRSEEAYQDKLAKLQRRRDSALEVLLKHQSLEHR